MTDNVSSGTLNPTCRTLEEIVRNMNKDVEEG